MSELPFVPGSWAGQAAFLIGGGSSGRGFDFERLRKPGRRVIAVNSAAFIVPWADMLFFADNRWYGWNKDRLPEFVGGPIITRTSGIKNPVVPIFRMKREAVRPLSREPQRIAGWDSGACAINLAALMHADPIFLCFYDMDGKGNWHDWHQRPGKPEMYPNQSIPALARMATELAKDGRRVINTNPNSKLRVFPFLPLEDALKIY